MNVCLFLSEMAQKNLAEITEEIELMKEDEEKKKIIKLMERKHRMEEGKHCSLRTSET